MVLGDKGSKRAGGRDDRAKGGRGAPPMRMTKAGAAAGIWRYGRETSGGEGRHRQRATSAHGGWEENDTMVRRKQRVSTRNRGENNYLCFCATKLFSF